MITRQIEVTASSDLKLVVFLQEINRINSAYGVKIEILPEAEE
jgi:hypothetical protein